MRKYKVSDRDFKRFQKYCHRWISILGLRSYIIYFRHLNFTAVAGVRTDPDSRVATFKLAKFWNRAVTEEELDRSALHECLHVLLAEYGDEARTFLTKPVRGPRFYGKLGKLDRAEEAIVATLENVLINLSRPKLAK